MGNPGKASVPYQFLLETDKFELIPEDSNIGCGFIPEELLEQLLGKGIDAVQIRILSPWQPQDQPKSHQIIYLEHKVAPKNCRSGDFFHPFP
jgi:hypothetical protein